MWHDLWPMHRGYGYLQNYVNGVNMPALRADLRSSYGPVLRGKAARLFVARQWQPVVESIRFAGVEAAEPTREVVSALRIADLIVFCPSNPLVSLDPILALPSLRRILTAIDTPKIAVSPIVGGQALKGPAAKLMAERRIGAVLVKGGAAPGGIAGILSEQHHRSGGESDHATNAECAETRHKRLQHHKADAQYQ